jgi:phospholipid/cholesterol/gamma-HCH transport system substrate-binding protein
MMRSNDIELFVGLLVLAGILNFTYLAVKWGRNDIVENYGYQVYADFTDVGGLKIDAPVELAGVEIGRVKSLSLHDYQARVVMKIYKGIKLQEDCNVSVKTTGLLGNTFVAVVPGVLNDFIPPDGKIKKTSPAIDLEDTISKIALGKI